MEKESRLEIRISKETKKQWEAKAIAENLTMAEFIHKYVGLSIEVKAAEKLPGL